MEWTAATAANYHNTALHRAGEQSCSAVLDLTVTMNVENHGPYRPRVWYDTRLRERLSGPYGTGIFFYGSIRMA